MWGSPHLAPEAMMIGRGPDQGYRRCDAEIKATWAACADHAAAARAREAPLRREALQQLRAQLRLQLILQALRFHLPERCFRIFPQRKPDSILLRNVF